MKKIFRRAVLTLFFMVLMCNLAYAQITAAVTDIAKYGNLILDITGADLFEQGYEYGDILEAEVLNQHGSFHWAPTTAM